MLDLKSPIPRFPETRKRFILKEGPMKLIDKQMKVFILLFMFDIQPAQEVKMTKITLIDARCSCNDVNCTLCIG